MCSFFNRFFRGESPGLEVNTCTMAKDLTRKKYPGSY